MVCKCITATTVGIDAYLVEAEIDVINSLPNISIVGLGDNAVQEAKERIRSAVKNSGYTFPKGRVVINLAPADIKKEGTNFDLPMAVGILLEEGLLNSKDIKECGFMGELSLDGSVRAVNGILPLTFELKSQGVKTVFVPKDNAKEAALVQDIEVLGVSHLGEIVNHFANEKISPTVVDIDRYLEQSDDDIVYDFKDVKGQEKVKKALEIAAAGGHNLLMTGSPGSGKTLMAKCIPSILPPLELSEAYELTKIYSVAGLLPSDKPLMTTRPFRVVHHTASANGIIGGGANPKAGEITFAHRGVLFLDEMVEFPRNVLETLRQPLEDGEIVISRTKNSIKYPTKFMLIGAMNPCPCGFLGDKEKSCTCSDFQIQRYQSRLSGPLVDRIDLVITVPRLSTEELIQNKENESSEKIRERVVNARKIQAERFKKDGIFTNAEMPNKLIKKHCNLSEDSAKILEFAATKYQLSGRKYNRVLKLARTIADLEASNKIEQAHISQALQYK